MLMIPPFVQFMKCLWKIKDRWISETICVMAYLNFVIQMLLQLTGILGLRQISLEDLVC